MVSWIYESRDATGGKFPLNSCDKFRCCFCQLFEILVRNEIRVESSKYSRNLEFSASSRFDSIINPKFKLKVLIINPKFLWGNEKYFAGDLRTQRSLSHDMAVFTHVVYRLYFLP